MTPTPNDIAGLEQFFKTYPFPDTPTRLREGITVTDYKQFGEMHIKAIKKGDKFSECYYRRLRELRVIVMYCRNVKK